MEQGMSNKWVGRLVWKGAHRINTSKEPWVDAYGPHTHVTFKYKGCNWTLKNAQKANPSCDWELCGVHLQREGLSSTKHSNRSHIISTRTFLF